MSSAEYARYQSRQGEMRLEYLRSLLGRTSTAVHRSWLLTGKFHRVTADGPGKRKWVRKRREDQPQWIEHVRDGVALTAHGAELLKQHKGEPAWDGLATRQLTSFTSRRSRSPTT